MSRRIRNFEDDLGFKLFFRTTRDVRLTEAGHVMLARTAPLMRDFGTSIEDARAASLGKTGSLRIGYMSFAATKLMPDIVKEFAGLYPSIRLEITYMRTNAQKLAIQHGDIDVGFMLGPNQDPKFESIPVAREHLRLVMLASHPLAQKQEVTLRDVAGCRLVLGNANEWDFFRALLKPLFADLNLSINVGFEASNTMGILGLVASGLGQTIYVESISRIQPEGLVSRPIVDCTEQISTVLSWRRGYLTPVIRNFVTVARQQYQAIPLAD